MDSQGHRVELVENARAAKESAYQPYSEYSVGAAVMTADGSVFRGVNIENITYDLCSHAERTAINTAIAEGHREFEALAISVEDENGAPPCGTCRQFIAEFCPDSFMIFSDEGRDSEPSAYELGEIFPHAFRPQDVEAAKE